MRITPFRPRPPLAPFVRSFTVVETREEFTRRPLPAGGIILGIRFRGSAQQLDDRGPAPLPKAALVGMRDTVRHMWTSAGGAIALATFHAAGAAAFFCEPLHEFFGTTVALDDLVSSVEVDRVSSRIAEAADNDERVAIFEQFLLARQGVRRPDPIVEEAARAIHAASGSIRMGTLAEGVVLRYGPLFGPRTPGIAPTALLPSWCEDSVIRLSEMDGVCTRIGESRRSTPSIIEELSFEHLEVASFDRGVPFTVRLGP